MAHMAHSMDIKIFPLLKDYQRIFLGHLINMEFLKELLIMEAKSIMEVINLLLDSYLHNKEETISNKPQLSHNKVDNFLKDVALQTKSAHVLLNHLVLRLGFLKLELTIKAIIMVSIIMEDIMENTKTITFIHLKEIDL